jgi:TrmH family RNA methyltransferase
LPITRAELKKVKALHTRKGRRSQGRFVAEGVRLLEEAYRFGINPAPLYYSPDRLSPRAETLLGRFRARKTALERVSPGDLSRLASAETSQGLLAVCPTPTTALTELHRPAMRNILLCENLSDPGNVGTLIRSALAFGFDLVILCGRCAEPFSPKVVRSSVGAVFGLPIAVAATDEALGLTDRSGIVVVATDLAARTDLGQLLPSLEKRRLALAIGSEADGLSQTVLERARSRVRIRHSGKVESLNSAMAGSILMQACYDSRIRRKT